MKIGSLDLDFTRPAIMGIVNATPDSFSDGGRYLAPADAIAHAQKMIDEGADILDIGGESTRPGAAAVDAGEELDRVLPIIEGIRATSDIPISIDTQKALVAAQALEAGADMINDISAGNHDVSMLELAAARAIPIVLMHMKGTPATMQDDPRYGDIISEITAFLGRRIEAAEKAGIKSDNIIIDPGIGFGKTARDNISILLNIATLCELNKPILLGTSRKSFIGKILGYDLKHRLESTLATLSKSYEQGARLFRVHDVGPAKRYLAAIEILYNPYNM